MLRNSGRVRALLVLSSLLVPLLAVAAPAHAEEESSETTTRLFRSSGPFPRTININARVRSDAGVPTGSVTFYEIGVTEPVEEVPLDATGLATTTVGTPVCGPFGGCEPEIYRAVYNPTGAFAGSEGAEGDGLPLKLVAEPTVLGLGGPGLLRITLTTAVRASYSDGIPAEGALAYFTLGGNAESPDPSKVTDVCYTQVDQNGLASCRGSGGGAAVQSLLGKSAYANVVSPDLSTGYGIIKLPPITLGR